MLVCEILVDVGEVEKVLFNIDCLEKLIVGECDDGIGSDVLF